MSAIVIAKSSQKSLDAKNPSVTKNQEEVKDGSLLAFLLGQSFFGSYSTEPRVIPVQKCSNCGVYSADEICQCLKLLPPSSLEREDEDALAMWQDDGGEG